MKRSRRLRLLFVLLFPVMLFSQGCFISTGPGPHPGDTTGDMVIAWDFNGQSGCPNDVHDVRILINGGQSSAMADCNADKRQLDDLAPGTYVIRVQGLDSDGTVTWESNERGVVVVAGGTVEADFDLADLP